MILPYLTRLGSVFVGQLGLSEEVFLHQCTLQSAMLQSVASPSRACLLEVSEVGVVCMMRAFGIGGRVGPIIAFVPQESCHCLRS